MKLGFKKRKQLLRKRLRVWLNKAITKANGFSINVITQEENIILDLIYKIQDGVKKEALKRYIKMAKWEKASKEKGPLKDEE